MSEHPIYQPSAGACAPAPNWGQRPANVLAVIPCLNEEAHLDALLDRLVKDPGLRRARIAICDGGSTDASREIARAWSRRDARIFVLDNARKIQSAAVNSAVAALGADVDFIIRIDAHASYPPTYCAELLAAQLASGADCVTVAMRAIANTDGWFQIANAAVQNSVLGAGGSPHRSAGKRRFVDHGHHALFSARAFSQACGYDERFSHNEDAELDVRLARAGASILLAGDIVIAYHPRAAARALWRQYFAFGRGRMKTQRLHRLALKPRQILPLIVAPALALAPFGVLQPWLAFPALAWAGLCLGAGIVLGAAAQRPQALAQGLPAMIIHSAWSAGYWRELLAPARL